MLPLLRSHPWEGFCAKEMINFCVRSHPWEGFCAQGNDQLLRSCDHMRCNQSAHQDRAFSCVVSVADFD
ncbi:expressed unknown protein [Seminavis robusta]|uniref:Uncharacterized protein n=1 Tax=Seminavis robusta TaxID=568900 RepID=A0A9N8HMH9_9STRA|nr:expressed unknown protein [Seminavis robusta]|eukprot:Sro907_g218750.1 n/a (69) ;mRNA; r:21044-21345